MLFYVLGAVAAAMLLKQKPSPAANAVAVPTSTPSNYHPAQPSLTYPFRPTTPPRVDNANQPWYAGSRTFNDVASTAQTVAGVSGSVSSVVSSLSDVWGSLFPGSTDDPAANLESTDSLPQDSSDLGTVDDGSGNQVGDMLSEGASDSLVSYDDTGSDSSWF